MIAHATLTSMSEDEKTLQPVPRSREYSLSLAMPVATLVAILGGTISDLILGRSLTWEATCVYLVLGFLLGGGIYVGMRLGLRR